MDRNLVINCTLYIALPSQVFTQLVGNIPSVGQLHPEASLMARLYGRHT